MLKNFVGVLLIESSEADYRLIENLLLRTQEPSFELQWVQNMEDAERVMESADCDICLFDDSLGTENLERTRQKLLVRGDAPLLVLKSRSEKLNEMPALPESIDSLFKSRLSAELLERTILYSIERKRIETVLQGSSAQHIFLSAIENLSVGVFITDPRQSGNPLIFVNAAFTSITGYTLQDVPENAYGFLAHPDSDPQTLQALRNAISARRSFKGVFLSARKDGTTYHNSLIISPVFNEQGGLINFVGLSEDVTAHYEAEQALLESEKRFESMVANVPGMIYRVLRRADKTISFLYVSEGCREVLGIEREQLLNDATLMRRMVHPDDKADYERSVTVATRTEHPQPWSWQGRFVLSSHEEKICQSWCNPNPQGNGDVIWDGLLMDVTASMRAQQKAARLAAIVENSNDAIISSTLDGVITSWNRAAELMLSYNAEEIIGQPMPNLLPPDHVSEFDILREQMIAGDQVQGYETVWHSKNGSLLDVELTISPIKSTNSEMVGLSTIVQDITHRKIAQAKIEQQIRRIQALRNIDIAITGSLDLNVTLSVLLDQVTTHLHVDSAAILLMDAGTQRLQFSAGRGFRTAALQRTDLHIGEGYAGRAALERRMITVSNLLQDTSRFPRLQLMVAEDFIFYCAVPLITKGIVVGVLEVFRRSPLQADDDWFNFLQTLATQAAIAIENAGLFVDLQHSNAELQSAYDSTLEGWSKALDLRDKETVGHSQRVTEHTLALARAMQVTGSDLAHIRRGALLHDIGKMGVPDAILLKPGPLNEEEWSIMRKHPIYAYELLSPINYLRPSLDIPYCHHEKWDGSGYPRGLQNEQIPLGARIFAVIDVWDALRSNRPYRPAWTADRVRHHIAQGSNHHFDPAVVKTFLDLDFD